MPFGFVGLPDRRRESGVAHELFGMGEPGNVADLGQQANRHQLHAPQLQQAFKAGQRFATRENCLFEGGNF